jgi:hypothetical protein
MKITKSWFKTSIEVEPKELDNFVHLVHQDITHGLFVWIRKVFGLNMLPTKKTK